MARTQFPGFCRNPWATQQKYGGEDACFHPGWRSMPTNTVLRVVNLDDDGVLILGEKSCTRT